MRLYLASRFARGAEMEQFAEQARAAGFEVTSRWHNGSHGDPNIDSDLTHPGMPRYAVEDLNDVARADVVVSFTHGGGGKGGRHVEFGLGLAWNKRMVVVGPREHVFHTVDGVERVDTWSEALGLLSAAAECAS